MIPLDLHEETAKEHTHKSMSGIVIKVLTVPSNLDNLDLALPYGASYDSSSNIPATREEVAPKSLSRCT